MGVVKGNIREFSPRIFISLMQYYVLGTMASDRYMAICHPLHYNSRMSRPLCICLVTAPYLWELWWAQCRYYWPLAYPFMDTTSSTIFTVLTHPSWCSQDQTLTESRLLCLCVGINLTIPSLYPTHHPYLLHFHFHHHHEDPFQQRPVQSLLHPWLPPDRCRHVFWVPIPHVSETSPWAVCWTRENCGSGLYLCESHAESIYLQPEEERCEAGFENRVSEELWHNGEKVYFDSLPMKKNKNVSKTMKKQPRLVVPECNSLE